MGNQQSGGPQFCSRGQLYTDRGEMSSFKSDPESRVGYDISTRPKFQVQRIQNTHQQIVPQQQMQEEIVEIPLEAGISKFQKSFFDIYDDEPEVAGSSKAKDLNKDVDVEMMDYYKDYFTVFEGVFGNIVINKTGVVVYTDLTGKEHCDNYDRENIEKIFPMGISFGGLTKSIWFKDASARNEAFDMMIFMPPSYNAVMANPTKFAVTEDDVREPDDNDNMKIFEGINETNVIVHADNIVLYTDINKTKHCVSYDKHNIRKCFPNGICYGGLPKSIWFNDEMERDLCFMLMQWNMEDECDEKPKESSKQNFTGLYGAVVLHPDSQIEFTSLTGDHLKCFYEPSEILEIFPMGIAFGRLPKTLWFQEVGERDKCIEAMRKM